MVVRWRIRFPIARSYYSHRYGYGRSYGYGYRYGYRYGHHHRHRYGYRCGMVMVVVTHPACPLANGQGVSS